MTSTQVFPLGGDYVSGRNPGGFPGGYTGKSEHAIIGKYVSTGVESDHIPGTYVDVALPLRK